MRVRVESYAGPCGDQTPRRFALDGREVNVADVLDHWPGRDYRYFKVKGEDGNVYILRFDETSADWELILFRSHVAEALIS